MARSVVVFVHGFHSNVTVWDPFRRLLEKDPDFVNFIFDSSFSYPTYIKEWNPLKRIPSIRDCGKYLNSHIDKIQADKLFLVGHSMGGLVIQSCLASMIDSKRGKELRRIRSVVEFATPNRGSTIANSVRSIFRTFLRDPQEEDLQVLSEAVAETSDKIVESVLHADSVDTGSCPIPFRVFWGLQDNVVTEVSAKGPFAEASPLPGGHNEIIQPESAKDDRYLALKDSLLNPVGHPCIYEIDLFDVRLSISPLTPGTTIALDGVKQPPFLAEDKALRDMRITFADQNRCTRLYEGMYRSKAGYVEKLGMTVPNLWNKADESTYQETGRIFKYVFQPERKRECRCLLAIYNGYGPGERSWHNHMDPKANYKKVRFTLDVTAYRNAAYVLTQEPQFYFYEQDIGDHEMCKYRALGDPLPCETPASSDPWLRTWSVSDIKGGVIDIVWDYRPGQ